MNVDFIVGLSFVRTKIEFGWFLCVITLYLYWVSMCNLTQLLIKINLWLKQQRACSLGSTQSALRSAVQS